MLRLIKNVLPNYKFHTGQFDIATRDGLPISDSLAVIKNPIAIIDIGSNSVRLVVYESEVRTPMPIFNEKATCALGKGLATTGRLDDASVAKAIKALKRFRILASTMHVEDLCVIATAAVRDASNGAEFLAAAQDALGVEVDLLSGEREAYLSALGVISGIRHADGLVGDMGGGSLELVDIAGGRPRSEGVSLPLGGLNLSDASGKSPRKAVKLIRDNLVNVVDFDRLRGRDFFAVGGTWRSLARLHMQQNHYPLSIMHNYAVPAEMMLEFCHRIAFAPVETIPNISVVSGARRALLPYGALLLEEIIRRGQPARIIVSALGVREGLLYERLSIAMKAQDPLLAACRAMNELHARSSAYGDELCSFTDRLFAAIYGDESQEETSLRHAVCYLSDIGWRAHPDYRGENALNMIAHANFTGVDHAGRAFLALAASYRHIGLDQELDTRMKSLVSLRALERARVLGAVLRVAYVLTAAMPSVLPRLDMACSLDELILRLPHDLADLASERLTNRFRQLGSLLTRAAVLEVNGS